MEPYYEEGGITIYHADCLSLLSSVKADFIITDPPYGISYRSGWSRETRGHPNFIVGDGSDYVRTEIIKLGLPTACFATWRCVPPIRPAGMLIWEKGDASGMGDLSFPWKTNYEVVWIFGSGWTGRRSASVFYGSVIGTNSNCRSHPHEKPVWLLQRLAEKAPGTVLDPCMGTGTTLVAAKNLGRRAIGIEIEERYCEIAAERLRQGVLPFAAG